MFRHRIIVPLAVLAFVMHGHPAHAITRRTHTETVDQYRFSYSPLWALRPAVHSSGTTSSTSLLFRELKGLALRTYRVQITNLYGSDTVDPASRSGQALAKGWTAFVRQYEQDFKSLGGSRFKIIASQPVSIPGHLAQLLKVNELRRGLIYHHSELALVTKDRRTVYLVDLSVTSSRPLSPDFRSPTVTEFRRLLSSFRTI